MKKMAVKGTKREDREFTKELNVGFAEVKVVAINPTRAEMNELFGKEGTGEKEEFKYLDKTKDGEDRLTLTFWLQDVNTNRFYTQRFWLVAGDRLTKDKKKVSIINSTCDTFWAPLKVDKKGNPTDKVDESLIQNWFLEFTSKDKQEVLGEKNWKKCLRGEDEMGTLLKAWLKMNWYDPETEVMIDTAKLFKEDYRELRSLIGSGYDGNFTVLMGVRTSDVDSTKKYQEIYSGGYLPSGYMGYIKNMVFPEYPKKIWNTFLNGDKNGNNGVKSQYGFSCYYELVPVTKYDETKDPVSGNVGKPQTEPATNEY